MLLNIGPGQLHLFLIDINLPHFHIVGDVPLTYKSILHLHHFYYMHSYEKAT